MRELVHLGGLACGSTYPRPTSHRRRSDALLARLTTARWGNSSPCPGTVWCEDSHGLRLLADSGETNSALWASAWFIHPLAEESELKPSLSVDGVSQETNRASTVGFWPTGARCVKPLETLGLPVLCGDVVKPSSIVPGWWRRLCYVAARVSERCTA